MPKNLKDKLTTRAVLEKIDGRDITDAERKALGRLNGLPVKRIIDIIQYLQNQIIPSLKKKSGSESKEVELFSEIVDLLFWSVASDDRARYAEKKVGLLVLERQLLADRLRLAEMELARYQTAEELLTTDFLEHYLDGARRRINELIDSSKKEKSANNSKR